VARTHDGRNSRGVPAFWWASCGPRARAEGLLDVLAGDLVAAGYAVGVDGEQYMHAVPGAGSDFSGRGAGGKPQRQRGMAKVVGAACRLGACLAWAGRGTGLVPDPAIEAFAERAAAGTLEQPPIFGAPEGPQVPAQEAGKLRGIGTVLMAPSGRCLRLRGSRGVPLPVQARADRGRDAVSVRCPQPREGRAQEVARSATASAGRSAA